MGRTNDRGKNRLVEQGGAGRPRQVGRVTIKPKVIRSPSPTDEIMTRARELESQAPGDYTRVGVRIFREFGIRYSTSTVRRWFRDGR